MLAAAPLGESLAAHSSDCIGVPRQLPTTRSPEIGSKTPAAEQKAVFLSRGEISMFESLWAVFCNRLRGRALVCAGASALLLPLSLATASASAETLTIGNSLTAAEVLPAICHPCSVFQSSQPGATLSAPVDGHVKSWSYRSGDEGAEYRLEVLHQEAGEYKLSAESPVSTVPNSNEAEVRTITLAEALPIKKGEIIALHVSAGQGVPTSPTGSEEDVIG